MKDKKREDNPLKAAALVGALGIDVAMCIFVGYWLGSTADDKLGSGSRWTVTGILLGLAIGLISAVLIVMKVLEDSDG